MSFPAQSRRDTQKNIFFLIFLDPLKNKIFLRPTGVKNVTLYYCLQTTLYLISIFCNVFLFRVQFVYVYALYFNVNLMPLFFRICQMRKKQQNFCLLSIFL